MNEEEVKCNQDTVSLCINYLSFHSAVLKLVMQIIQ